MHYYTAVPVPVFVGTLLVVIAVLILLTVIIAMLCIRRGRGKELEGAADRDSEYDDVMEKAIELSGAANPMEMKANEAYGTHQQEDNNTASILETSTEAHYEELH